MSQIAGSRVLITGGVRGIGRLVAERLIRRGASLALVDRDEVGLREAAALLAGSGKVATVVADLTQCDAVYQAAKDAEAALGGIDILINNAGFVRGGPLTEVSEADHTRTFELNVLGVTRMTRAILPGMLARRRGHVVNIASAAGLTGVAHQTTYCASKWAVVGFSEALVYELEEQQNPIEVTCICPSFIDTGMFTGVTAPTLVPILQPDDVANAIVKAVEKNTRLVTMPTMVGLIPTMRGLLPSRVRGKVSHLLGINTSMKGWTGHK